MTIEEEIFQNTKVDFAKLIAYGFQKDKSIYKYSQNMKNDTFRVEIEVNQKGNVKGKIFDLAFEEEYINFRREDHPGSFIEEIKEEFKKILRDIKTNCFTSEIFKFSQTNRIIKLIQEKINKLDRNKINLEITKSLNKKENNE